MPDSKSIKWNKKEAHIWGKIDENDITGNVLSNKQWHFNKVQLTEQTKSEQVKHVIDQGIDKG